jgi:hypothetical protein
MFVKYNGTSFNLTSVTWESINWETYWCTIAYCPPTHWTGNPKPILEKKLLPNKIMFVKYNSTSFNSTSVTWESINPENIDAPLLIHLNALKYLSIWSSVVVWKHERKCNCKWTHKKMRQPGMSTLVATRLKWGTSLTSLWVTCIGANSHLVILKHQCWLCLQQLVMEHSVSGHL